MLFFKFLSAWFSELLLFCGYVCGNNTFPPPLSQKEETKYLERLKDGDSTARKILIERNLRLVVHIAKKYSDENSLSDFISIGTIGLIKGIDTYNFQTKNRLSPYVSRCIENEILMALRKNKKNKNDVSIDDTIGIDKEGNTLSLADIIPADCPDIADCMQTKDEIKLLQSAIDRSLTPAEKVIIYKRYGIGGTKKLTQREIAKSLGISRSYVSRIEKKCLGKLLDEMIKK